MKIVNCIWELANLNKRVAEISMDREEIIEGMELRVLEKDYDYLVVKLQSCNFNQYKAISEAGFSFIESQITITKDFKTPHSITDIYKSLSLQKVIKKEDLEYVLFSMTSDMFTTDRIYLDSQFAKESSLLRYRNWTRSEFERGASLYHICYNKQNVGFILFRFENCSMDVLLWGLYEQFQHRGLGDLIPLSVFYYNDQVAPINRFTTKVSSNNKGIISKLNNWNFHFSNFEYVFVKHIK